MERSHRSTSRRSSATLSLRSSSTQAPASEGSGSSVVPDSPAEEAVAFSGDEAEENRR